MAEFTFANVHAKVVSDKVGSHYPKRENFRLTPEVKEKFTEKLRQNARELCGHDLDEEVRAEGLKLVFSDASRVCYWLSGTSEAQQAWTGNLRMAAKYRIFRVSP